MLQKITPEAMGSLTPLLEGAPLSARHEARHLTGMQEALAPVSIPSPEKGEAHDAPLDAEI